MLFQIPFRETVALGSKHTIRIETIGRLMLEIAGPKGGVFTVVNNHFTWCGFRIRASVENGRVDLILPEALGAKLGLSKTELVPA